MSNAGRSEAGKEGGDIAGVGDSEGAGRAVVIEGEADKFGCDGVSFTVIEGGEARDEKGKVGGVVVFDTEVNYHQDKGDWARGVTEETGGVGLVKVKALEDRPKESVRRDNGIEEDIYTGEGSDKCGGRDGRFKTVAASGAPHTPVDVRYIRARRTGEKKRRVRTFFTGDRVVVGRGG